MKRWSGVSADAKLTQSADFMKPSAMPLNPLLVEWRQQPRVGQFKVGAWVKSASAPTQAVRIQSALTQGVKIGYILVAPKLLKSSKF